MAKDKPGTSSARNSNAEERTNQKCYLNGRSYREDNGHIHGPQLTSNTYKDPDIQIIYKEQFTAPYTSNQEEWPCHNAS